MAARPASAASQPRLLASGWRLFRLCLTGPAPWLGLLIHGVVAILDLASILVGLRLIQWNADFFNALQKVDAAAAIREIGVFGVLTAVGAGRFLLASFLRKRLQLRWRTALTAAVLDTWLAEKRYWRLERRDEVTAGDDNADQRIADDCRIFVEKLTTETLELITACVGLTSYVVVLWQLSAFPLGFELFGAQIEIPRYMIWAAPVYVALSTGLTHLLGAPLYRLSVAQQRREADFRFALVRLRENAEGVAIWGGEPAERRILNGRFLALAANFRRIVSAELVLGLFTRPYMQTVLQIPLFLALPAYLAGQVTLGGLMQLRSAFQNVVTNLSYFIFSYRDITELAAATRRLSGFLDSVDGAGAVVAGTVGLQHDTQTNRFVFSGVVLSWPGRPDCRVPDLAITPGEHTWISGLSGAGKTSLVRALSGLPQRGAGCIVLPPGRILTVPQKAYSPLSTLSDALLYPACGSEGRDGDPGPKETLAAIELPADADLATLSGGEHQRLALGRALLARPDWLIMDEPFASLDAAAALRLLERLVAGLPRTTFLIVSHGTPPGLRIRHRLALGQDDPPVGGCPSAEGTIQREGQAA